MGTLPITASWVHRSRAKSGEDTGGKKDSRQLLEMNKAVRNSLSHLNQPLLQRPFTQAACIAFHQGREGASPQQESVRSGKTLRRVQDHPYRGLWVRPAAAPQRGPGPQGRGRRPQMQRPLTASQ